MLGRRAEREAGTRNSHQSNSQLNQESDGENSVSSSMPSEEPDLVEVGGDLASVPTGVHGSDHAQAQSSRIAPQNSRASLGNTRFRTENPMRRNRYEERHTSDVQSANGGRGGSPSVAAPSRHQLHNEGEMAPQDTFTVQNPIRRR